MTVTLHLDASGLSGGVAEAAAEINRIAAEEIAPAAALIEGAFASAADGVERALARAARTGELSLKGLARSIALDLKRLAIDSLVRKPIESLLTAAFGGGRAEGGIVAAGQRYLVGERGPEYFTPSVSGSIGASPRAGVNVSITLPGVTNAEAFRASETQIAASLARALARGERNL